MKNISFSNYQQKISHKMTIGIIVILLFSYIICIEIQSPLHCQVPLNQVIIDTSYQQQSSQRMLQINQLHNFRINANFPTKSSIININLLSRQFSIATNYFYRVLRVKSILSEFQKYPDGPNSGVGAQQCGNVKIPTQYLTTGFNTNITDMQIIPQIYTDKTTTIIASAQPCILKSWITYAIIQFNSYYFNQLPNDLFHFNIISISHQLIHSLGFAFYLFTNLYTSTQRTQFRILQNVRTKNAAGQYMIITPNVLNYVQSFFNCNDNITGALLEDQNDFPPEYSSHWEIRVYNNQLMVALLFPQSLQITGLTLNFLKDTNYYDQVDVSYVWKSYYGKGKGCQFANGQITVMPENCDPVTFPAGNCDMTATFQGLCTNFNNIGNAYILYPLSTGLCRFPSENTFFQPYQDFNAQSSCINTQNNQSHCFLTTCSENNKSIFIKIGQNQYQCNGTQNFIIVSELKNKIECPNIEIACANQGCLQWCNSSGLCIDGICYLVNCTLDNCNFCIKKGQKQTCKQCKNGLILLNGQCLCEIGYFYQAINQKICQKCHISCLTCSNNALNCTSCDQKSEHPILSGNICINCNSNQYYSKINKACVKCDINCNQCNIFATNCTKCYSNFKLINNYCVLISHIQNYGGFCQNQNGNYLCQLGCSMCSCQITNDSVCIQPKLGYTIQNQTIIKCLPKCLQCDNNSSCKVCIVGFYVYQGKCSQCSLNCLQCDYNQCKNCISGFYINSKSCEACKVQHCSQCTSNDLCIQCQYGYTYVDSLKICQQCPTSCGLCSTDDIALCLDCTIGFYLLNNKCNKCIQNCDTCQNSNLCITCKKGYYKNQQGKCIQNCKFPCALCSQNSPNNCTQCFVGYTLTNNHCIQNITDNLLVCPLGYQNQNAQNCTLCKISNCASCQISMNLQQICSYCFQGYFLSQNNNCEVCSKGCQICLDSKQCYMCSFGFTKLKNLGNNSIESPQCYSCQAPCATCQKKIDQCTSCIKGYLLQGIKCVFNLNVIISILLNSDFASFVSDGKNTYNFRKSLLNYVGLNVSNISDTTITSISEGSVLLNVILASSQLAQKDICSNKLILQRSLAQGQTINNYSILSSSFTNSFNCETTTNNDNHLTLILGITIPVSIILLFILALLAIGAWYKLKPKAFAQKINQTKPTQLNFNNKTQIRMQDPPQSAKAILNQTNN